MISSIYGYSFLSHKFTKKNKNIDFAENYFCIQFTIFPQTFLFFPLFRLELGIYYSDHQKSTN